jgi:hypothetical protein
VLQEFCRRERPGAVSKQLGAGDPGKFFEDLLYRPANETVEKLILQRAFRGQAMIDCIVFRSKGGWTGGLLGKGSVDRPKTMDLADIVN